MPKRNRLMSGLLIPLTGIKTFPATTQVTIAQDFFAAFGQEEVLGADVRLSVWLDKEPGGFSLALDFDGKLVLCCDRCMEEMDWPLSFTAAYALRRAPDKDSEVEGETEDGREIIIVDASAKEFDAAQVVYDELCLHIPIRHTHPAGGCNPAAVKYLTDKPGGDDELTDTPFAVLKDLQL